MDDIFAPVRAAIEAAQATLKAEERVYWETMDILVARARVGDVNETEFRHWKEKLRRNIEHVEYRIVQLKQMAPPYAVDRGGYLELLPAWEPIDPRAPVTPPAPDTPAHVPAR